MKRISIVILLILMIFSGCSSNPAETEEPSERPTVSPVAPPVATTTRPSPTPTPEPTSEPFRNPLNGAPLEEDISMQRPYAVMINNVSPALPHCGVSAADIIYEVLAEGGVTRMMVVFSDLSEAGVLGSIRSVRPYYLEIARSYDAIVIHAGGSVPFSYDKIRDAGMDTIDGVNGRYGEGTAFYRDVNRMAYGTEHSLFTTSDLMAEYTGILEYRTEHEDEIDYGLTFSEEETSAEKGSDAANIQIRFAGYKTSDFLYNEDEGVYYMTQYSQKYIDGNTQQAVDFTNVMVIAASTAPTGDEYARIDVSLSGSGDGYFANGGKIVPIKWQRAGDGATFTYTTTDGKPLVSGVGRTFIAVIPNEDLSGFSYS